MIKIVRTGASDAAFKNLVSILDADLAVRDGDEHAFYDQYNKLDSIKYALVAYKNDQPIACGAIKEFDHSTMEVKRMFTAPECRGEGIAVQILSELEKWAAELSYKKCVLETGVRQPEAIRLYEKCGYSPIPNYGQYIGVDNSRCFEKKL
ncbi:GNAT family N-acetyltransferase [Fulvivirga sediminis]|uniref:GNAT family N-acetyltransferase n=1 Tax=Fulvivirga sediminis TaxID=2803949 RepID=A0A937JYB2_9BACT|nr:GNAT family N-acetyltransferase [Fulvivirga sediminis]MBL3656258.1 GNAT family N-acetyltransferase [Fulvivirga sediminis]